MMPASPARAPQKSPGSHPRDSASPGCAARRTRSVGSAARGAPRATVRQGPPRLLAPVTRWGMRWGCSAAGAGARGWPQRQPEAQSRLAQYCVRDTAPSLQKPRRCADLAHVAAHEVCFRCEHSCSHCCHWRQHQRRQRHRDRAAFAFWQMTTWQPCETCFAPTPAASVRPATPLLCAELPARCFLPPQCRQWVQWMWCLGQAMELHRHQLRHRLV
mmetsp:Transcript_28085/g.90737  ORF Transcript_28085/g.90737 Transcript_28085/m.90737 type:complete len:216 (+) Transcript_28085:93-740(+)